MNPRRTLVEVIKLVKKSGFTPRMVRCTNHYCIAVSNGLQERMLVTAKTPSDYRNLENVQRNLNKIRRELELVGGLR